MYAYIHNVYNVQVHRWSYSLFDRNLDPSCFMSKQTYIIQHSCAKAGAAYHSPHGSRRRCHLVLWDRIPPVWGKSGSIKREHLLETTNSLRWKRFPPYLRRGRNASWCSGKFYPSSIAYFHDSACFIEEKCIIARDMTFDNTEIITGKMTTFRGNAVLSCQRESRKGRQEALIML